MQVEIADGDITVDAAVLAELLDLAAPDIPDLLRTGSITSLCERGVGEHAGQFRLTFFHGSRRARLSVNGDGHILQRSTVDYGAMARVPRRTAPDGR